MDELQGVLVSLLVAALTAATPILVGFLVQYLRKQLKKAGLEATDQELETMRQLALEGIAFAAQQAKVELKLGKDKMPSEKKKALAVAFAKKLAGKYGVSETSVELLDEVIESTLARGAIES